MVLLLYNGAIKFSKQGLIALEERKLEPAHQSLVKAQDIISELSVSLNHEVGGDISRSLEQLYDYMSWRLVEANIQKDKGPVEEVIGMLEELRDTWTQVGKTHRNRDNDQEPTGFDIAK